MKHSPVKSPCPNGCGKWIAPQGRWRHFKACPGPSTVDSMMLEHIDPTSIINAIIQNPDRFTEILNTAIQSQRNAITGWKGDIEQAERIISRLENFRGVLNFDYSREGVA